MLVLLQGPVSDPEASESGIDQQPSVLLIEALPSEKG